MDLSVVIRCCDDRGVFRCIKSIDENVEIIVSLCKNEFIMTALEELNINYCLVPRGNLSKTSNAGINIATNNKIILTDSDTVFHNHSIRKINKTLESYDVVKAKLLFQYHSNNLLSKIAAEARDFVNSLPVVYTPGIGFKKDLLVKVGGFYFNDPVPFAVDADLNFRIQEANLKVMHHNSAFIYHIPVSLKHDLKAAFRIGAGCAISAFILSKQKKYKKNAKQIRKRLKGVKIKDYPRILKEKGSLVLLYQLVWDFFFFTGQIIMVLKLSN